VLTTGVASGPQVPDSELWLTELAALTAAAIANASNREELKESRARVLVTADRARRQLQRDVHDGAQQWLVQTVLTLELALASDPDDSASLVTEALRHARRATVELRHLVHGILPASLTRDGLRTGLEALAADYPGDLHLDADVPRLPLDLETTAYFVVAEGLTNVVKHAPSARARVTVALADGRLSIEVVDDGPGGADPTSGTGLLGLQDRVAAAGGSLRIRSAPGQGTALHAEVPVLGLL
jgi:signal transduction histidine kinase